MADLSKKSPEDLQKSISSLRDKIDAAKRDLQQNKTEAVKILRTSKKELARTLTEMNARKGKEQ